MRVVTIDLETYWSATHSLTKMSPIAYVMHPDTQIISCAAKVNDRKTFCEFGEAAIREGMSHFDWSDVLLVGHNMSGFDAMILAWRLGVRPKMWGCTLAMATPFHAKTTGLSLGKLVEHYGLGVKDQTALVNTKGKRLEDFTQDELQAMKKYNMEDVEQCYGLFRKLAPRTSAKEMKQIDATIRMLVEPKLEVDRKLLVETLAEERHRKIKMLIELGKRLDVDAPEEVQTVLASAPKFKALLESFDVECPMKVSPSNPDKMTPALAKTDEAFLALQEHDNPIVAAAAQARLGVKSTILETRIEAFIAASDAAKGKLPVPLKYYGGHTGRWSGWAYNPQNLPRISGKPSDALRNCLRAPKGHKVVVADLSGIELRVNHFLWQVPSSMALYQADPEKADLYKDFASMLYNVPVDEVTKAQRQVGKVAHLGLGFSAGYKTFVRIAKMMGGVDITEDESRDIVTAWRNKYMEIVQGWRTCQQALRYVLMGEETDIDPWGLCTTTGEGFRLPSGRLIFYPELRQVSDEGGKMSWKYGLGRHETFLTGGKCDENLVQALARDVMADNCLEIKRVTGHLPALLVHDEWVGVVPEEEAEGVLAEVQRIMRTPPKWWPELITWSEGDIADTYGAAK